MFEHANTRKHVFEHSCSSVRMFLSILAHLAHLAQSFFFFFKRDRETCTHSRTYAQLSMRGPYSDLGKITIVGKTRLSLG